jgi:hypothetical protein
MQETRFNQALPGGSWQIARANSDEAPVLQTLQVSKRGS